MKLVKGMGERIRAGGRGGVHTCWLSWKMTLNGVFRKEGEVRLLGILRYC